MTGGNGRLTRHERRLRVARRTTTTWAALIVAAALIVLPAGAGPAAAGAAPVERPQPAKTPEVQLQLLDQDVDAGASFDVRVRSKHVRKAKVLLQHRAKGTRTWDTVAKVARRGVSTVPGTAVGVYTYRLVVQKRGKVLAKSKGSQLRSYGNLSLQQYCAGASAGGIHTCAAGSTTVGGAPFAYQAVASTVGTGAAATPSAEFANSSCGSVTLRWAGSDPGNGTASVLLTQDKPGGPAPGDAAAGTIGQVTFPIGSKGWQLHFYTATGTGQVTWDATLNCFTATGSR